MRLLCLLLLLLCGTAVAARAQAPVPALMLSDIHFDPFQDPARVPALVAAPVAQWPAILNRPASATAAADLQALQTACSARALDTSWPLLKRSLAAARQAAPGPRFITISGDLLAHAFDCRLDHTAPDATPAERAAFAARTVTFVLAQVRAAYPSVPVFATLGNNDSGCGDYREMPGSSFLAAAATSLAEAAHLPATTITPLGDYSVPLPAPLQRTRLLVLNDIFQSRLFRNCAGNPDATAAHAQLDWLRQQLAAAQAHGEQVWILSHIPPGIDVYASFRRYLFRPAAMCAATPVPFLTDDGLADLLLQYAPIIRLGLFGHTHMDEFRLLATDAASSAQNSPVPLKIVPSISPVDGNHPSFLVAKIDPQSSSLRDWTTVVSPDPTGSLPPWAESYHAATAYGLPALSPTAAQHLVETFTLDHTGTSPASTAFRQHFFPGDLGLYALGLAQIWPAYACAIRFHSSAAVQSCICSANSPSSAVHSLSGPTYSGS